MVKFVELDDIRKKYKIVWDVLGKLKIRYNRSNKRNAVFTKIKEIRICVLLDILKTFSEGDWMSRTHVLLAFLSSPDRYTPLFEEMENDKLIETDSVRTKRSGQLVAVIKITENGNDFLAERKNLLGQLLKTKNSRKIAMLIEKTA